MSSNVPATHNTMTPEDWWSTAIIDMKPGMIRYRGYAIEELIGRISFAEMVYLITRGELPDPAAAKLLEAALVAAVDHGPQAPSIAAARMAITCGVGINNAMASAINILGDVHGGAGEQCVTLYNAIAARMGSGPGSKARLAQAVSAEIKALVEAGTRHVPGFGHRFHPRDPHRPRDRGADCGREGTTGPDEYRWRDWRGLRGARLCASPLPGTIRIVALGWRIGPRFRGDAVGRAQQRTNPAPSDLDLYWPACAQACRGVAARLRPGLMLS